MMIRNLALLPLLLAGCSLILDPETCSADGDCEGEGAVCTDGICIASTAPRADTGDVTPDVSEPDAEIPDEGTPQDSAIDQGPDVAVDMSVDAANPDVEVDAAPVVAPTCEFEAPEDGAITAETSIPVRVQVRDEDTDIAALQATINNIPIALDEDGLYVGDQPLDEGEVPLNLRVVDPEGGECTQTHTVTSDRTAPELLLRLPREPLVTTTEDALELRVDIDEVNFAPRLFINDVLIEDGVTFTDESRAELSLSLVEGENVFNVTVEDRAGNRASPLTVTAVRDTTGPVVERLTPQEASTYAETIEVTGRITEAHTPLDEVQITVQVENSAGQQTYGADPAILVDSESGEFSETIRLEEGQNTVQICAFDALSNHGCVEFELERLSDAACATLEAVTTGQIYRRVLYVSEADFTLSGTTCPNVLTASVEINGETIEGAVMGDDDTFEVALSAPDAAGVETSAILTVNSERGSAQVAFSIVFDPTPPVLLITERRAGDEPLTQSCTSSERVSVCGEVSDDESGLEGTVSVNGESGGVQPNGEFCVALVVDLPGDEVAGMRLVASAANQTGAITEEESRLNIDRRAPTVEWTPVEGGWIVGGEGGVVLSADFESGICETRSVTIDGVEHPVEDDHFEATLALEDGAQTLIATILDHAGNMLEVEHSFNVDGTAPTIELITPEALITSDATVEIVARVFEDGSGIAAARIDGVDVALEETQEEGVFEIRLEVSAANRAEPLVIEAEDFVGLTAAAEISITFDDAPPIIELITAETVVTSAATVEIVARVSDMGSGLTAARIDGVDVALVETQNGGVFEIRLEVSTADRAAPLVVEAEDLAGLIATAEVTITFDDAPPIIELITAEAVVTSAETLEIVARVSDLGSGLAAARIDGVDVALVETQDAGVFEIRLEVSTADRAAPVVVEAEDLAGLITTAEVTITFDDAPPIVELITAEIVVTSAETSEIVARVSDLGSGVTAARIDGVDVALVETQDAGVFEIRHEVAFNGRSLDGQAFLVTVEAEDEAGLITAVEVSLTLDDVAPEIVISAPLADEIVVVPFTVTGTVTDATSEVAALWINGQEAAFDAQTGAFEVLDVAPDEAHDVVITAEDSLGNLTDPGVSVHVSVPLFVRHAPEDTGFNVADARGLSVEDLDGDGDLDLFALSYAAVEGSMAYHQLDDGTFEAHDPQLTAFAALDAVNGDFNQDGRGDWVVTNAAESQAWLSQPDGSLALGADPSAGLGAGLRLAVGNPGGGAGLNLLQVTDVGALSQVFLAMNEAFFGLPVNAALLACLPAQDPCTTLLNADAIAMVDFGPPDHRSEIIAVGPNGLSIWNELGANLLYQDALGASALTFIDAPRDGILDLVTLSANGAQLYTTNRVDPIEAPQPIVDGAGLGGVAADLDGDAMDDLLVFDDLGLQAWRQAADGALVAHDFEGLEGLAAGAVSVLPVDIDLDGDMDVLVAEPGGVSLFESNLSFLEPTLNAAHVRVRSGALEDERAEAIGATLIIDGIRALQPLPFAPTLISMSDAATVDASAFFPNDAEAQVTLNPGDIATLSEP